MKNRTVTVQVKTSQRTYPIHIGGGLLATVGQRLHKLVTAQRATIITDRNVVPLYADKLTKSLRSAGIVATRITIPPGDASKSLSHASRIYDQLAARRHSRDEPIIALGGGVVGDLAGFVAATWQRGVPLVQCPTTLEAMIDASIGGKTAVNHAAGKNLIGAFHQPILVAIDADCLRTLSDRDYRAGLAESVKHAVIADAPFFKWHEKNVASILKRSPNTLIELIRRNVEIKAKIVEADERETATQNVGRATLNFGHTIGHAIEAQAKYKLRHGEAVALGMVAEMELGRKSRNIKKPKRQKSETQTQPEKCSDLFITDQHRIEQLLQALGLPIQSLISLNTADLLKRMASDKKVSRQILRFVIPTQLGRVTWLTNPSPEAIRAGITKLTSSRE